MDLGLAIMVLVGSLLIVSPALLLLPWIFITRIPLVRKILGYTFFAALLAPFATAATTAKLSTICLRGHFDQPFGDCGVIPDSIVDFVELSPLYVFGLLAFTAIIYCAGLEAR